MKGKARERERRGEEVEGCAKAKKLTRRAALLMTGAAAPPSKPMAAFFLPLLALLAALAGGYYQFHLKGVLDDAGVWRTVQPHGTDGCTVVTALPACESASGISRPSMTSR